LLSGIRAVSVIPKLVQAGLDVNALCPDGCTPLHWCCRHDEDFAVDIARALLDNAANIELCGPANPATLRAPVTPLLTASRLGSASMVELLLSRGADIHSVSNSGLNALMLASLNRVHGAAIIPLLIRAGLDANALRPDGDTALVRCCRLSDDEAVKIAQVLLLHGARVEDRDTH
jgi:ankyrin repeat protein